MDIRNVSIKRMGYQALAVALLAWAFTAGRPEGIEGQGATRVASGTTLPSLCVTGNLFMRTGGSPGLYACNGGSWEIVSGGGGSGVPTDGVIMVTSGACPDGYEEVSALDGKFLRGTVDANMDVGDSGGSDNLVPAGTNSAPLFTGAAAASTAVSAGTPGGTNSAPTFTGDINTTSSVSAGTPTGSVAAPIFTGSSAATSTDSAGTPAGTNSAPTFTGSSANTNGVSAGTPAGTVSAPTFTGSALNTHRHELPLHLGTNARITAGYGTGSSIAGTRALTNTNQTTAANVALSQAVSAGTPAGTNSAPTFTGSALNTHSHSVTATGTVAAPTFTGNALGAHGHTVTATGTNSAPAFAGDAMGTHSHSLTPTGAVAAPVFTGNELATHTHDVTAAGTVAAPTFTGDSADNRPAFVKVIYCKSTGGGGGGGAGSGALVLLESHTASGSATLDFTTRNASGQSGATFQSDFDEYEIRLQNVLPSSTDDVLGLQVSTDGGSTWVTASSSYFYAVHWTVNAPADGAYNDGSFGTTLYVLADSVAASTTYNGFDGVTKVSSPLSATYHKWRSSGAWLKNSGQMAMNEAFGLSVETTAVTAFRVKFVTGNIAGGTILVYGVAK